MDIGRDGTVDLAHLQELLRKDTVLVAVSAVDGELGTVQPIDRIAKILRQFPNCRLHVDATQAVGKLPLALHGADTVSIAPHKFYGLNGSGLLIKQNGLVIEPQIHGGVSTTIYRSGTPSKAVFAVSRDRKNALPSWRISLSHLTTQDTLTQFLLIFDECYKELVP